MIHTATGIASGNTGFQSTQGITDARDMPPLILEDLEGVQRSLHDWHGKVIILNFRASWCGPCQAEIPHFIRYRQTYAERGLQIIGVGMDERRKVRNFVRTLGIDYPILLADAKHGRALLGQWGDPRQVLPFSVVIARDGHIHLMQTGILDEESFTEYVLPLLDVVSDDTD
jgi:peroxiredoxin